MKKSLWFLYNVLTSKFLRYVRIEFETNYLKKLTNSCWFPERRWKPIDGFSNLLETREKICKTANPSSSFFGCPII
jgi:hypothetical protein